MLVWIQIGTSDTREVFSSSRLFVMGLQWVLTRKVGGRAGDQREPPLWHRCAGDNWLLLRNEHKVPHAFRDPSFNRAKTLSFLGKGSKLSHARSFLAKTYYYFWGRNSSKVRLGWGACRKRSPHNTIKAPLQLEEGWK